MIDTYNKYLSPFATLIHETIHYIMNEVFKNNSIEIAYTTLKEQFQKFLSLSNTIFSNDRFQNAQEKFLNQVPLTILETYILYRDVEEYEEFIARYYEDIAIGNKNQTKELMKPLKDYIKKHITPVMEKYIDHHLNKHLLNRNNFERHSKTNYIF